VISDTPVLGDDFILGNSKKTPRNLQEGPQLFRHITQFRIRGCDLSKFKYLYCFMSLAGGDGITLHKITKYADIKRKKPVTRILIYLKCWDPDPYPDSD
jgi:hypothetical protein